MRPRTLGELIAKRSPAQQRVGEQSPQRRVVLERRRPGRPPAGASWVELDAVPVRVVTGDGDALFLV